MRVITRGQSRRWVSAAASTILLAAVAVSQSGCGVPAAAPEPSVAPAAAAPAPAPLPAPASTPPLPAKFAADVEMRIARLHRVLKIQPGQEASFAGYAETIRGNARAIHMLFVDRIGVRDSSAPAGLRWYAQLTAAHAEGINRLIAPFDALYQTLSPVQQALADRYFRSLRQRRMARGPR